MNRHERRKKKKESGVTSALQNELLKAIQFHINKKLELKDKINCFNVKFGFEGDLSKDNRRGNLNGWKFSDLPWKQQ